jgi:putative transposase
MAGRRQIYPLRRIVDSIFYLLRTGAQWLLPEYPVRSDVFYHYANTNMHGGGRTARGSTARDPKPCARAIAAVSAGRGSPQPRSSTINRHDYCDGWIARVRWWQKINGRKRHLLVDTQGTLLKTKVRPADIHDRAGAELLLSGLEHLFPTIERMWGHTAYRRLRDWLRRVLGWKRTIPQHWWNSILCHRAVNTA